jgi:DNA-binding NarL/FixJ family response regulator
MNPASPELTSRERQVLVLTAHGLERKEIHLALRIAEGTVKTHSKRMRDKLNARNSADAVRQGYVRRILGPCGPQCEGCRYWATESRRLHGT